MRCPVCRRTFKKKRRWQKYCTEACGSKRRGNRRTKKVREALRVAEELQAETMGALGGTA